MRRGRGPQRLRREGLETLVQELLAQHVAQVADLGHDVPGVRDGVLVLVVLQVLERALVGRDEREDHAADLELRADVEVLRREPHAGRRVLLPGLAGPLAGGVSGVPLLHLPDAYVVVRHEDADDELAVLVLGVGVRHAGLEAQDPVALLHDLGHVPPRGARREGAAAGQRVLLRAEARVGRVLELGPDRLRLLDLHAVLLEVHVLAVELPAELVAVVEHDRAPVRVDGLADDEVLGLVDLRLRLQHARRGVDVRVLAHRALPPEDGVGVPARVPRVALQDLHGVIREVVVEDVVLARAVARVVVPVGLEAKDLAVVLQVLLELLVAAAPAQGELAVGLALYSFARAGGALPLLLGELRRLEGVHRRLQARLQADPQGALVERAREVVGVHDPEGPGVDVEGLAHEEVLVRVEAPAHLARLRDAVPLHEGALCEPRVLHLGLGDHHRAVLQVELHAAVPHPEGLRGVLVHRLQEERVEAEHLAVVLQPGRRDRRPVGVPRRLLGRVALVVREGPARVREAVEGVPQLLKDAHVQGGDLAAASQRVLAGAVGTSSSSRAVAARAVGERLAPLRLLVEVGPAHAGQEGQPRRDPLHDGVPCGAHPRRHHRRGDHGCGRRVHLGRADCGAPMFGAPLQPR
mmetsp:Transcript_231/g.605  ORF Transcript_231/g.605 Transcript_231/m.605 type:complete len:637 (+) Transcript_231:291-2201(+)